MLLALAAIWGASFLFIKVAVRELDPATLIVGRLGLAGVALLVGAQPQGKVLGALAVVGMAFCYGIGGLLTGRYLKAVQPIVVSPGSTALATLVWLPVGVVEAPGHMPGWKTIGSVVALGIPGTALAYLLFFALISGAGAAYTSLVTYLIPPIALAYGAIFLGERFGAAALGGLALILAGVALGTGGVRVRRPRVTWARDPRPIGVADDASPHRRPDRLRRQ